MEAAAYFICVKVRQLTKLPLQADQSDPSKTLKKIKAILLNTANIPMRKRGVVGTVPGANQPPMLKCERLKNSSSTCYRDENREVTGEACSFRGMWMSHASLGTVYAQNPPKGGFS